MQVHTDKKKIIELTLILKGMAIILVVAFHVFFALNDRLYYAFCFYLRPFRMPVFMFVSGYLYVMISREKYKGLASIAYDKFKRLLIPMLFFQVIVAFETMLIDLWRFDSVDSLNFSLSDFIKKALLYPQQSPNAYLWFVYVLFIIFLLAHVFRSHLGVFWLLGVLLYFVDLPSLFDLNDLKFYLQYFALGALTFECFKSMFFQVSSWVYFVLALVGLYLCTYYFQFTPLMQHDDSVYYLARSYSGLLFMLCFAVLLQRYRNFVGRMLGQLGRYSASIYFLHIPFYHLVCVYLLQDRLSYSGVALWVAVAVTVAVGLAGPILLDKYLISKHAFAGQLLLGRKTDFALRQWCVLQWHRIRTVSK